MTFDPTHQAPPGVSTHRPWPRLSAFDTLQRGALAAWANWELAVVSLIQNVLVVGLLIGGVVPVLAVIGFGELGQLGDLFGAQPDPERVGEMLLAMLGRLTSLSVPLLVAGLALLLFWFIAGLVFCACQAGTLAVLLAGDRQAVASSPWPGTTPLARAFRAFSWRAVLEGGQRHLWRVFWFINLYVALLGLVLGLWLLVLILALVVAGERQLGAAFGVGCVGSLPVFALFVALLLWYSLAYADLCREGSGTLQAARTGLRLLLRRLGAALLLLLLMIGFSGGVGLFFAGVGMVFQLALAAVPTAAVVVNLVLTAVQWFVSGFVQVAWLAATIALVRSEVEPPVLPGAPVTSSFDAPAVPAPPVPLAEEVVAPAQADVMATGAAEVPPDGAVGDHHVGGSASGEAPPSAGEASDPPSADPPAASQAGDGLLPEPPGQLRGD